MTDTVIAFAITTNKGWHGYTGEIPLIHLHAFFRELYVAFNPYKIRLHTRMPQQGMIRVAYSSIALFFKQPPNKINVAAAFAATLDAILCKHATLYAESSYLIRQMDQHKDQAFVTHVETDKEKERGFVPTEFHNEWFAMPLYDASSLHRFGKEEGQDPPGKEYNRIFEYEPEHGHISMYRGNNYRDRWIVYKLPNVSNHMYYMDLNNIAVDGIYDGTKCEVLLNVKPETPTNVPVLNYACMCEVREVLPAKQKVLLIIDLGISVNVMTLNENLAQVWFENSVGNKVHDYVVYQGDKPVHEPHILGGNYVINMWDSDYNIVRASDKKKLAEIRRRLPVLVNT